MLWQIHPYLQQLDFVKWLQAQGIAVTAYSPFGNLNPTFSVKDEGKIVDHPVVLEIAQSEFLALRGYLSLSGLI